MRYSIIEDGDVIVCNCYDKDAPTIIKYLQSKGMCLFDWWYTCPLDEDTIQNDFTESLSFMKWDDNSFWNSVIYCLKSLSWQH